MLRSLHIENYVLIDSLDVEFPGSLCIITGQTGAGKSILLGALGLLHRFVPEFNWRTAWPILLIVLGIFLLLPSKQKES